MVIKSNSQTSSHGNGKSSLHDKTACCRTIRNQISSCLVLALITVASGCQSTGTLQQAALSHFDSGNPQQAIKALTEATDKRQAETEILQADLAIAELMAGNAKQTERQLKKVQEELDYLVQKDLKEQTLAVLSDSRSIAYSGREFENGMIRNLLTLSSMVSDRQDTFAFAGQAMEVVTADLQQLTPADQPVEQIPGSGPTSNQTVTVGHHISPGPERNLDARKSGHSLAAYLYALVHSENALDHQLTKSSVQQIGFWSTELNQSPSPAFGTLTPRQHGSLHVITLTDRVTDWIPENALPTTAALLLADQILSAAGEYSLPPTVAPVKIARPAKEKCLNPFVTSVQIINQTPWLRSQPLLDLNHAAWDSYQANRDRKLATAVARRIVKKAAVYTAKDQMSVQGGSEVDTLLSLTGVLWESLEKADTRHVSLLPGRIEVVNTALPVGQHNVLLRAVPAESQQPGSNSDTAASITVPVTIQDGRNTVILCFRIGRRYVGNILINDGSVVAVSTNR